MDKRRMESFSDAVLAIIITIMVLEFTVPHGTELSDLKPLLPIFLTYALSFVLLAIYWNNHHHMMQATHRINGAILWANINLLFWLSLFPFATAWMGENHFKDTPTAFYGCVNLLAAISYWILQQAILREEGKDSPFAKAIGRDVKGKLSPVLYLLAIGFAFVDPRISGALYLLVGLMWLVPDRRAAAAISAEHAS